MYCHGKIKTLTTKISDPKITNRIPGNDSKQGSRCSIINKEHYDNINLNLVKDDELGLSR